MTLELADTALTADGLGALAVATALLVSEEKSQRTHVVALAARAAVGTSSTSQASPSAAGPTVRSDWTRHPIEPHFRIRANS